MARILTRDDVARLLSVAACIEAVEQAQRALSAGEAIMPVRLPLRLPAHAVHLSMPAALPGLGALGLKAVTAFPGNPAIGEPQIQGVVVLNDITTGRVLAVMDAAHLTGVRTAAASALATRELALPDASVVALLGAGVQAATHLEAIAAVRPIVEARVAARSLASAERFVREHADRAPGVRLVAVETVEEAVSGAHVVCAVSSTVEPIVRREWIAPGAHLNAVGAHTPTTRELDSALVRDARVVGDSRDAVLAEKGDCLIPLGEGAFGPGHVSDEIGDVLLGRVPGRTSPEQITAYMSCGLAVQDVAAARLVHELAVAGGVGVEVAL
ncbi:MAG: ornithine cyclodeaminase family protein [Thermoleophilia bacterium]